MRVRCIIIVRYNCSRAPPRPLATKRFNFPGKTVISQFFSLFQIQNKSRNFDFSRRIVNVRAAERNGAGQWEREEDGGTRAQRLRDEDGRDAKSAGRGERSAFRALASVTRLRSARHSLAADRAARSQRYSRTYTAVDTRKRLRPRVTEDRVPRSYDDRGREPRRSKVNRGRDPSAQCPGDFIRALFGLNQGTDERTHHGRQYHGEYRRVPERLSPRIPCFSPFPLPKKP